MIRCAMPSMIPPRDTDGLPTWVSNLRVNAPPGTTANDSPYNSGRLLWTADRESRVPIADLYDIVYREMPPPTSSAGLSGSNRVRPDQPSYMLRRQSRRVSKETVLCEAGHGHDAGL